MQLFLHTHQSALGFLMAPFSQSANPCCLTGPGVEDILSARPPGQRWSPTTRCTSIHVRRHAYGCAGLTTWQGTGTCEERISAEGPRKRAHLCCGEVIVICDICHCRRYICTPSFLSSVSNELLGAERLRQNVACPQICTSYYKLKCGKYLHQYNKGSYFSCDD